jgi:hypothetical protein
MFIVVSFSGIDACARPVFYKRLLRTARVQALTACKNWILRSRATHCWKVETSIDNP